MAKTLNSVSAAKPIVRSRSESTASEPPNPPMGLCRSSRNSARPEMPSAETGHRSPSRAGPVSEVSMKNSSAATMIKINSGGM